MVELKLEGGFSGEFGGIVVVIGANGAGKTTLLQQLHGIGSGKAHWDGQQAKETKDQRGFVTQSPQLLHGTVEYNLNVATKLLGMDKANSQVKTNEVIAENKLEKLRDRYAPSLSGGEQARLCFARACLNDPNVILLDEITAHLDPENTKRLETAMRARAAIGTVFFVTHILSQARRLADYVIFLDHGEILFSGKANVFWNDQTDERIAKFLSGELL